MKSGLVDGGGMGAFRLDITGKGQAMDEGFNEFMERPMTKLVLSMIPAAENPDAVKTLLREVFAAGEEVGEGVIIRGFVEHLVTHGKPPGGPIQVPPGGFKES